jgi:hypothetical protein
MTGIRTDTFDKTLGYFQLIGKAKQKQVEAINNKREESLAEIGEAKLSNKLTIYCRTILTPKNTCNLGLTLISKTNSDTLKTKMLKTSLRKRISAELNWSITRK